MVKIAPGRPVEAFANTHSLASWARLCRFSYEEPSIFNGLYPGAVYFNHVESDTQFYRVADFPEAGSLTIVFRGTEISGGWSWTDIYRNLRLALDDWPAGGRVHAGYGSAIRAIAPWLVQAAQGWEGPVFLTGHSLGGALATVAASLALFSDARAITFGAPAAGDAVFNRAIEGRLTRVVLHNDIAPKHPRPYLGYRQPARYLSIDHHGASKFKTWSWWDARILPFTSAGVLHGEADHKVALYEAYTAGIDR